MPDKLYLVEDEWDGRHYVVRAETASEAANKVYHEKWGRLSDEEKQQRVDEHNRIITDNDLCACLRVTVEEYDFEIVNHLHPIRELAGDVIRLDF